MSRKRKIKIIFEINPLIKDPIEFAKFIVNKIYGQERKRTHRKTRAVL